MCHKDDMEFVFPWKFITSISPGGNPESHELCSSCCTYRQEQKPPPCISSLWGGQESRQESENTLSRSSCHSSQHSSINPSNHQSIHWFIHFTCTQDYPSIHPCIHPETQNIWHQNLELCCFIGHQSHTKCSSNVVFGICSSLAQAGPWS